MSKKDLKHGLKLKPASQCKDFSCHALGCPKAGIHMLMVADQHGDEDRHYFCDHHFVRASQERQQRFALA